MKALTFREFYALRFDKKIEYLTKLGFLDPSSDFSIPETYDNIRMFEEYYYNALSQPFKPELITELFEDNKEAIIHFHKAKGKNKYEIIVNNKVGYYPYPRTLDDFINDCQRAGIELTWRTK